MKKEIFLILMIFCAMVSCNSVQDTIVDESGVADLNRRSGVSMNVRMCSEYSVEASKVGFGSRTLVADDYPMTLDIMSGGILTSDIDTIAWWNRLSDMPAVVDLKVGNYVFVVKTAGQRDSISAIPYYEGTKSFDVIENKVSSEYVDAVIKSMAISCSASALLPLTDYTMSYYDLKQPKSILFSVNQQQNEPTPRKVYMDKPFGFGVKISGKVNGLPWIKNILVWDNINVGSYQNLILE